MVALACGDPAALPDPAQQPSMADAVQAECGGNVGGGNGSSSAAGMPRQATSGAAGSGEDLVAQALALARRVSRLSHRPKTLRLGNVVLLPECEAPPLHPPTLRHAGRGGRPA